MNTVWFLIELFLRVLVGYKDDNTLVLQGKGNGGVPELVQHIKVIITLVIFFYHVV